MEYLFVDYGVAEEPWHERLLLKRLADTLDFVILTPDLDMYVETISAPPLDAIRICGPERALPVGLGARNGQPVHRFSEVPSAAALKKLLAEATTLATMTMLSDAGRYGVAPSPVKPIPSSSIHLPIVSPRKKALGKKWVCLSVDGGAALGSEVEDSLVALHGVISGNLALVSHPTEPPFLVKLIDDADVDKELDAWKASWKAVLTNSPASDGGATPREPPPAPSPPVDDARTLAIERNTNHERYRSLLSAVNAYEQNDFVDWPLDGPRTALWLAKELSKTGMNPIGRHSHWRHETNIKDDERSGSIHELLSEVLELMITYDQLDLSNLASAETLCRHMQLIEFETKKKNDARKGADSSEYYLGRSRRTGGNLLSPELQKHIADKASRDTSILKEQRKAAEERALTRKTTKGDQ
jgi:hypothetical protein